MLLILVGKKKGMMDKILDFGNDYNGSDFVWSECSLYKLLCEYYMVCDVLIETVNGMVLIKKHNIVGYKQNNNYITVYESRGEMEEVKCNILLDSIKSIEVLL